MTAKLLTRVCSPPRWCSEAALLRRLAVFPSDIGLDAVEAVATQTGIDRESVLELLSSLIEKSFVTRLDAAANARYKLHETMREYALLKLRGAEEELAAIKAFVTFYADMCRAAETAAQSPQLVEWLKRMDQEADNVRAALAHCLHGPDHPIGVSMVGSLLCYWTARATSEGAYWLDLYLERRDGEGADDPALARALFARGYVSMVLGDATTASPVLEEAEAKARAARDAPLLARILSVSAGIRVMSGDLEGARSQLDEAKTLAQGLDDPGVDAMLALTEGFIALGEADVETAGRVYAEWAPRARDRGDLQTLSYLLSSYGFSLLQKDQPDQAGPLLQEALGIERRLENRDMILYVLDGLASHAAMVGRLQRSARLLGAAETLQTETGIRLMPHMEPVLAHARETIATSLGIPALESETQAGKRMSTDEAIAFALEEKKAAHLVASPVEKRTTPLSKRELEIARLVADGMSNKEIGSRCFLSERTVETHVSNILNKLGINSRVEVARWVARELGSD
jgi:DNA-binding CsgD family transcriptional regulator